MGTFGTPGTPHTAPLSWSRVSPPTPGWDPPTIPHFLPVQLPVVKLGFNKWPWEQEEPLWSLIRGCRYAENVTANYSGRGRGGAGGGERGRCHCPGGPRDQTQGHGSDTRLSPKRLWRHWLSLGAVMSSLGDHVWGGSRGQCPGGGTVFSGWGGGKQKSGGRRAICLFASNQRCQELNKRLLLFWSHPPWSCTPRL